MSHMIRKQIYIHKRHQILLKRLAQARGVSQAEIIRQAIEREVTGRSHPRLAPDRSAWQEILNVVTARKTLGSTGMPYYWNRQDAYQERESDYDQSDIIQ